MIPVPTLIWRSKPSEIGRATGWLARSERLVAKAGRQCVERGYLLLPAANRHLANDEAVTAGELAVQAAEIGERFGDRDLSGLARCIQGRAPVRLERLEQGLALLDEVMVGAAAGELSPVPAGIVFCSVLDCCRAVYALARAREWTHALSQWCEAQPQLVAFSGSCRLHLAEIFELDGAWKESIEEARRAAERAALESERATMAAAAYQQAEIHRLRGEFESAEERYRAASRDGVEPQPGLALLRLAQGNGDAAGATIRRAVDESQNPLRRLRFLPAQVEIMLATGRLEEAERAAEELEGVAATSGSEILRAIAARARGEVALTQGDARGAIAPLRSAFVVWQEIGAPYISATIRVRLGQACRALGDEEGARLEFDAARSVFAALGAAPDLARIDLLEHARQPVARASAGASSGTGESGPASASEGRVEAGRPHGLTIRELEVLRLIATGKTNKAIGEDLYLSEKTVDRHVSNIFNNLDVSSRAAATAFAYRHKLI